MITVGMHASCTCAVCNGHGGGSVECDRMRELEHGMLRHHTQLSKAPALAAYNTIDTYISFRAHALPVMATTRSPAFTRDTPLPVSTTMPAISPPATNGSAGFSLKR